MAAWGVGLCVVALMVAGWGLVGLLSPVPVFAMTALICAGAFYPGRLYRKLSAIAAAKTGLARLGLGFHAFLLLMIVASGLILLLLAVAPDTSWDAVVYHLRLPSFFLMEHRIFHIPTHHFSAFPLNSEMLNSWLMLLGGVEVMGGGEAMKVFHLSCAFVAALAARRLVLLMLDAGAGGSGRKASHETAGWLAALLVLLCPLTGTISVRAYNDFVLAALAGIAATVLVRNGPGGLLLSGCLCGAACGVKYTAVFFAVPIAFIWWRTLPAPWLAASAAFLPWAAKNFLLTGSPVAPMFAGLFVSGPETAQQLKAYTASVSSMVLDPAVLVKAPWTLVQSIEGETITELLPILGAAYLLLRRSRGAGERRVSGLVLAFFLLWGLTAPSVRFFAAIFAPLAALCALGFFHVEQALAGLARPLLLVLLLLNIIRLPLTHLSLFDPIPFSLGRESLQDYETRVLYPPPYYGRMVSGANEGIPERARILVMIDIKSHYLWRRAYHDFQYVVPGVFLRWLRISGTVPGFLKKLRQEGVTHILVVPQGARGVGDHYSWRGNELALTAEFLSRHTTVAASIADLDLLEIDRGVLVRRPLDNYIWMLFRHPENLILAGENEKAAVLLAETKRLVPWLRGCSAYLGMALGRAGRPVEAMTYLKEAVSEGGIAAPFAANVAGSLMFQLGDLKGAESHWRAAIKLKPDFAEAYYNLGVLYMKGGKRSEAIREVTEACRLAPEREEFAKVLEEMSAEPEDR